MRKPFAVIERVAKEGPQDISCDNIENGDMIESIKKNNKKVRINLQEKYLAPVDSEDDEFEVNENKLPTTTIGNVPLEWYDEFPHIGYDLDGNKVMKPATKSELDDFLRRMDDPKYRMKFHDHVLHEDVTLTPQEIEIIKRLEGGYYPDEEIDPYPEFLDFFTQDVLQTAVTARPEPKSRFLPSKWEHKRVMKIVRAIRSGHIISRKPDEERIEGHQPQKNMYDIWSDEKERIFHPMYMPAPKMKLPDNSESYNPPDEYLPTAEEIKEWEGMDPEDRPRNYLPKKYPNLRSVPGYDKFIEERFSRNLDLYLCPRTLKKRSIDPETLIPKLPDPKELEPYPKFLSISYDGHSKKVNSISVDPTGQWLVSGSEDYTVKLWEVSTGRCAKSWTLNGSVVCVSWNPNKDICLFSAVSERSIYFINPGIYNDECLKNTDSIFEGNAEPQQKFKWIKYEGVEFEKGFRTCLTSLHHKEITYMTWHRKGDYFATVSPAAESGAVMMHQLVKRSSQAIFSKSKGIIQMVKFHPHQPVLFVATQRHVKVYNLVKQELVKTLQPGAKWISSIDVHPKGDNVIVGTFDKKLCWFDLDLSTEPYKTLRYDEFSVKSVVFHQHYPLFASCGDDGKVHIFHGMVYGDYNRNPLIVPVKILQTEEMKFKFSSCIFHPFQPWIFTAGDDDGSIKMFC
jgi:ribosome biogenesis protein ERB1